MKTEVDVSWLDDMPVEGVYSQNEGALWVQRHRKFIRHPLENGKKFSISESMFEK